MFVPSIQLMLKVSEIAKARSELHLLEMVHPVIVIQVITMMVKMIMETQPTNIDWDELVTASLFSHSQISYRYFILDSSCSVVPGYNWLTCHSLSIGSVLGSITFKTSVPASIQK